MRVVLRASAVAYAISALCGNAVATPLGQGLIANGPLANINDTGDTISTTDPSVFGALAEAGGKITIASSSIATLGADASGLFAINANSNISATEVTVTTAGANAFGARASQGALVQIAVSTIAAIGADANGLFADGPGARVTSALSHVTAVGTNAFGAFATGSGEVDVKGGEVDGQRAGLWADPGSIITTSAATIKGLSGFGAHSVGGKIQLIDGSVTAIGANANGLDATSSPVSLITAEAVTLVAGGEGIHVADGGHVTFDKGSLTSADNGVHALSGGEADLTQTSVNTTGDNAAGLLAIDASSLVNASNTSITTLGDTAHGAHAASGGTINLTDVTIDTTGSAAEGLFAESGAAIDATDVAITTTGAGAHGADAEGGASIQLRGTIVDVSGDNAVGLAAKGGAITIGPGTTITTALVETSGANGHGIDVEDGGEIDATALTVHATGTGANALFLTGAPGSTQTANFTDSTLESTAAAAMVVRGATANVTLTNGTLSGNGTAITIGDNAGDPGTLNMTIDPSTVTGAIVTAAGSSSTIGFSDSVWSITGNSSVTELTNNASTFAFTAPTGGVFKTLTVHDYSGTGGFITLNTVLGADGSPSDILIINGGTATGSTTLQIVNAGGVGAQTTGNGILVVDAINGATTTTGAFHLTAPVLAGPFEYNLFRSSVDASAPDSWFLRSEFDCTANPTAPICQPPPPPTPPPPFIREEVSLDAALPSLALLYGERLIGTLQQRVGDEMDLDGRPGLGSGTTNGVWSRFFVFHGEQNGGGIFADGPNFDYDIYALQTGMDLWRNTYANGSRDHGGVYVAFGNLDSDVQHFTGLNAGSDTFNAQTAGAYWTHFDRLGWYVDSLIQGTWYDAKTVSSRLRLLTDGFGFAASLEAGYPTNLGGGYQLEPQAQIVYQIIDFDTASDGVSIVSFDNAQSVAARIGARVKRTWLDPVTLAPQVIAWLRGDFWDEFSGDTTTAFSSSVGFLPFGSDISGSWFDFSGGIDLYCGPDLTVYAEANYQTQVSSDRNGYGALIGIRGNW